jgi:hypothetical protein
MAKKKSTIEDSGGSVSYYAVYIEHPWNDEEDPHWAECGSIVEALEMDPLESNIFKELWRRAAARQGKEKAGHNSLRGAEKISFFAERILLAESRK